jgi:hypothetical protein
VAHGESAASNGRGQGFLCGKGHIQAHMDAVISEFVQKTTDSDGEWAGFE